MKNKVWYHPAIASLVLLFLFSLIIPVLAFDPQRKRRSAEQPQVIQTNIGGKGLQITIDFKKGKAHNHALLAIWLEDVDSNYIQTLYVSQSIATSVFRYGSAGWGHWDEAVVRRPAALPYWGHQRGIQASDGLYLPDPENPIPDAYSGATPKTDFILQTRADSYLPARFRVLLEINQPWDWNQYWTNNKFPDDREYKTSSQPALVYEAVVDQNDGKNEYEMKAIGHSHYSGKDGRLYTDLSTLTTALQIADRIVVRIP